MLSPIAPPGTGCGKCKVSDHASFRLVVADYAQHRVAVGDFAPFKLTIGDRAGSGGVQL